MPPVPSSGWKRATVALLLFGVSFGYEDSNDKANAARVGRAPTGEAVRFHR